MTTLPPLIPLDRRAPTAPDPAVVAVYDALAPAYDARYDTPAGHAEDEQVAAWLTSWASPFDRVLDIGCGTGLAVDLLPQPHPARYTGIDPSAGMLDQFRAKHPEYADRLHQSTFGEWLAEHGVKERSYDLIVSTFGSANYLTPAEVGLIPRLLARGGAAFLMFYRPGYFPDIYDAEPRQIKATRQTALTLWPSTTWHNFEVVIVRG